MPEIYSHSRLTLFDQCRAQYRFKYVDRCKPEPGEGIEAFLGSRVHEALESLYRDVMMGRVPAADAVVADFHRRWEDEWSDQVLLVDPRYGPDEHRAVGEECLRRYHARHAPFRGDQTLGVEVRVAVEVPAGGRLVGFADRVARDPDGRLAIHDYKTTSKLPTQAEVDADRQLALYQAGVEKMWPGAPGVRLVWHFLRFDERLQSTRTREQIGALLDEVAGRIGRIESETGWAPSVSRLCDWCRFWQYCPEKHHEWALRQKGREEPSLLPSAVPPAEEASRAVADAVDALRRRRDAERDLQAAKARILTYARETGALSLDAPSGSARVRLGDAEEVRVYESRARTGGAPGAKPPDDDGGAAD